MSYYRTPEHRNLRAKLIQKWRPWEKSTGPRSQEGRVKVSHNAYKGGLRQQLRGLSRNVKDMLHAQQEGLSHVDWHNQINDSWFSKEEEEQ